MDILMVIAYRLRRGGNDNLNLTSNDNPILTPPQFKLKILPVTNLFFSEVMVGCPAMGGNGASP